VLATVSAYNATFGKKFDELFAKALTEIKTFGQALEEMGGTILTTVDGVEVTVDHVAAIEEKQLLEADYGSTQEKFRRVSKLKKELDRRPPIRRSLLTPAAQTSKPANGAGAAAPKAAKAKAAAAAKAPAAAAVFQPPAVTAQQLSAEESKLRRVEESIRVFVRVADPKYRQVVPMRFFNLTLTAPEADAYSAPFLEEKSLRADVARTLIRLVSISARISTELEELKRSQKMSSLWKMHADSVVVLLDMASTSAEEAGSHLGMHAQHDVAAVQRLVHLAHLDEDVVADGDRRLDHSGALADGAGGGERALQRLLDPLASDGDQAKIVELKHFRRRAVGLQLVFQRGHHAVAVLALVHVDEVDDDDAAQVAQTDLAHDLGDGVQVGLDDGVFQPRRLAHDTCRC
jgi:hypothetical protein